MSVDVTVVDSKIKRDMLGRLGAGLFIDYSKEGFTTRGQTYDVIFDMVAGSSYSKSMKILNPGGCYLSGNPAFPS
jgi:NADPH:quinone reductase-like Zn-dependent oxidoreductase